MGLNKKSGQLSMTIIYCRKFSEESIIELIYLGPVANGRIFRFSTNSVGNSFTEGKKTMFIKELNQLFQYTVFLDCAFSFMFCVRT